MSKNLVFILDIILYLLKNIIRSKKINYIFLKFYISLNIFKIYKLLIYYLK